VVFVVWFGVALSGLEKLQGPGNGTLHLIQFIGLLAALGSLFALLAAIIGWSDKQQWIWYRVWNVLLAVGCVGLAWFLVHWHLLNFDLRY